MSTKQHEADFMIWTIASSWFAWVWTVKGIGLSINFHVEGFYQIFVILSVGLKVDAFLVINHNHVTHSNMFGSICSGNTLYLVLVSSKVASFIAV